MYCCQSLYTQKINIYLKKRKEKKKKECMKERKKEGQKEKAFIK